ncbi:MAG: PhoH family protein, partial [Frankiaceae bacterium]|nr:PhoH family protein [Arenimonas sp.]
MTRSKRIYVLDTNVLMHDPTALFRFEEHDVFIPMMVLEELDNGKKGHSEASRNARQVSRFLNEILEANGKNSIEDGVPLVQPRGLQLRNEQSVGRLHFQLKPVETGRRFGNVMPDNLILGSILQLRDDNPGIPVVLVSKDINLRIKASICDITAEDYENDRAIDDFNLLFTGATELPADFWESHEGNLRPWTEKGRTFYEVRRK